MPNKKHMSWTIIVLIVIHTACVAYFLYNYFRTPPLPPTLVINLDKRKDRWDEVQQEFKSWTPRVERVSAIQYSPGWKGCTLSHRKVIEIAKERHYPWVLIIEDDCMLTENAQERFKALLPYLWKHQEHWDVFLGGATSITSVDQPKLVAKNPLLFKVKGFTTAFCLIHRKAYNRILHHMPSDPEKMTEAVDTWYRNNLRLWVTLPFIAIQRPSKSDIENKNEDYTHMFKDAETVLYDVLKKDNEKHPFFHL